MPKDSEATHAAIGAGTRHQEAKMVEPRAVPLKLQILARAAMKDVLPRHLLCVDLGEFGRLALRELVLEAAVLRNQRLVYPTDLPPEISPRPKRP